MLASNVRHCDRKHHASFAILKRTHAAVVRPRLGDYFRESSIKYGERYDDYREQLVDDETSERELGPATLRSGRGGCRRQFLCTQYVSP